jgi:tripartite-type tricarboxylate transporter receptor subunit TctC
MRPVCFALLLGNALAASAAEPAYPVRPMRAIVPQSAGGANDMTARLIAPLLGERLGQSVVVDNRPGAGAMLGSDLVAKAAPDGHTLLISPAAITITPSLYRNIPYDTVRDFAPVTTLTSYPNIVVVHPAVTATTIRELIALAKAKPGALNYASGGTGTRTHLDAELFIGMTVTSMVHVPYKGGGPAITALLAGQVQLYFAPIATVMSFVKSGKLRALAVTSAKRTALVPELPSVAEAGVPGFEHVTWNGMLVPARTPEAVVQRLYREVGAVLKLPLVLERFAAEGMEAGGIAPQEFGALIKNEIAKWGRVVKAAGIKPD